MSEGGTEDEVEMGIGEEDDVVYIDDDFEDQIGEEEAFCSSDEEDGEDDRLERPLHEYRLHKESVYSLSFVPESLPTEFELPRFVSGGGDELGYICRTDGDDVQCLRGHSDSVVSVSFGRDRRLCASASMDGTLKLWNMDSGELVATLEGPSESIECVAWCPQTSAIAAGSSDGDAWMWDSSPQAAVSFLQIFSGHAHGVNDLAFTPDGSRLVTAGADGALKVWRPESGQCLSTISSGDRFHKAELTSLRVSSDGALALTGGADHKACLSNLRTGRPAAEFLGHTDCVEKVEFVPDFPWILTAGLDGKIGVWDLHTGGLRHFIENNMENGVTGGVKLIDCTVLAADMAGYLSAWDIRSGHSIWRLRAHREPILSFDFCASRSLALTGSEDHSIKLFRIPPISPS